MVNISPLKITGNWFQGFVLDVHTISSTLLGYNEYGHEVFDTKRSELGELLYKLKYGQGKSVLSEIVEAAIYFISHKWGISKVLNCIIPIPPSNISRAFQPVSEIARGIGSRLGIPTYEKALTKIKETPELKDVYEYEKRLDFLKDAFTADPHLIKGKNVLLFDDLYRSGATLNVVSQVLYQEGKAGKIYVLVLTRTRSKS